MSQGDASLPDRAKRSGNADLEISRTGILIFVRAGISHQSVAEAERNAHIECRQHLKILRCEVSLEGHGKAISRWVKCGGIVDAEPLVGRHFDRQFSPLPQWR